jgi:hypothetical protein
MCTLWLTHAAAASLLAGSSARLATSAKSTRSVAGSRRVPASSLVITVSIPSRRHSWSSSHAPPKLRDCTNNSPVAAVAASAAPGLYRSSTGSDSRP